VRILCVLTLGFLLVWPLFAVPIRPVKKKDPAEELKKLQGTWRIVSFEKDGVKYSADRLAELGLLTFKGSDYTWSSGAIPGKIAHIDPNQNPKTIDYEFNFGTWKGQKELGIYEIKGNTFKDCFCQPGGKRPMAFSVKRGSGHTLVVYERVK
jgi:uncharacterized protein (TIGR03067 family)